MREIKFRAWHKKDKKMYEVIRMELDDNHGNMWVEVIRDGDYSCGMDEIELMQYTGLPDMEAKEMYELDIVERGSYRGIIKWDDIEARFRIYCDRGQIGFVNYPIDPSWKVIGNIWEHPQLSNITK